MFQLCNRIQIFKKAEIKAILALILAISFIFSGCGFGMLVQVYASSILDGSFSVSKSNLIPGETIQLEGYTHTGNWISIKMVDSHSNIVYYNGVKADAEGRFQDTIKLSESMEEGNYVLVVGSGNSVKTQTISILKDATDPSPSPSSSPSPSPSPTPKPNRRTVVVPVSTPTPIPSLVPRIDTARGIAVVHMDAAAFQRASEEARKEGSNMISIEIPKVEGIKGYELLLPISSVAGGEASQRIEVKTAVGTVILPPNMLKIAGGLANSTNVTLSIVAINNNDLEDKVRAITGDRPVVEVHILIDGEILSWSNPQAPVKISIPYTPATEEKNKHEHIVIFYIDGEGKAVPIPNGKYDPASGAVTFTTKHLGRYAIGYVEKSFEDIKDYPWAKREIEILASKGIINGTGELTYTPGDKITRADFLLLLAKTLELHADVAGSFDDVKKSDYYYEAVGVAKALGITQGKGNNLFDPLSPISRQEMMTLTSRALKLTHKLADSDHHPDLSRFADHDKVEAYAKDSIDLMVGEGLIKGDGNALNPKGYTSRAETAVLMYRVYNK